MIPPAFRTGHRSATALVCKARLEPRINDICIVRNLSGPSAANWQVCYMENPDCAKYLKYRIKTAVTPRGEPVPDK